MSRPELRLLARRLARSRYAASPAVSSTRCSPGFECLTHRPPAIASSLRRGQAPPARARSSPVPTRRTPHRARALPPAAALARRARAPASSRDGAWGRQAPARADAGPGRPGSSHASPWCSGREPSPTPCPRRCSRRRSPEKRMRTPTAGHLPSATRLDCAHDLCAALEGAYVLEDRAATRSFASPGRVRRGGPLARSAAANPRRRGSRVISTASSGRDWIAAPSAALRELGATAPTEHRPVTRPAPQPADRHACRRSRPCDPRPPRSPRRV